MAELLPETIPFRGSLLQRQESDPLGDSEYVGQRVRVVALADGTWCGVALDRHGSACMTGQHESWQDALAELDALFNESERPWWAWLWLRALGGKGG